MKIATHLILTSIYYHIKIPDLPPTVTEKILKTIMTLAQKNNYSIILGNSKESFSLEEKLVNL